MFPIMLSALDYSLISLGALTIFFVAGASGR
jgi:hypothetical protein